MRSFTRLLSLATALALTGSALAACGGDDNSGAGGDLENGGKITVASLPLIDGAALHIAEKAGLFKAEGVDVTIKPVQQSPQALPALQNDEVQVIAGANYVSFLQAHDAGAIKLRILNDAATLTSNMMSVVVPKDSKIKKAKDLEGKSVSVNVLNNIQDTTFNAILNAQNVDGSKVKYRPVPMPQMLAALKKGDVDAAHMAEPFLSQAQKEIGARVVVDGGADPVKDISISGYVTTQAFTDKNPKLAAAFQRAINKAQELAAGDRKKVEEVLPGYAKVPPEVASVITLPGYPTSNNETRLNRIADLTTNAKIVKKKPDMKTILFTPSQ